MGFSCLTDMSSDEALKNFTELRGVCVCRRNRKIGKVLLEPLLHTRLLTNLQAFKEKWPVYASQAHEVVSSLQATEATVASLAHEDVKQVKQLPVSYQISHPQSQMQDISNQDVRKQTATSSAVAPVAVTS